MSRTAEQVTTPGMAGGEAPHAPARTLKVRIWRGRDTGRFENYEVPWRDNQTVLDVVTEVQRHHEPALAYRFACRVGVCGSCAMTVNGMPRWTCRTHVSRVQNGETLTVEPLRSMRRIKDLVTDMSDFFDKWHRAGGKFDGTATRHTPMARIDPESRARSDADAALQCINCGICHAACDVAAWDDAYVGPAALNRAWTLMNDERHADRDGVLAKASGAGGCGSCHTQGSCMKACPMELSPTRSIAGIKRLVLMDFLNMRQK